MRESSSAANRARPAGGQQQTGSGDDHEHRGPQRLQVETGRRDSTRQRRSACSGCRPGRSPGRRGDRRAARSALITMPTTPSASIPSRLPVRHTPIERKTVSSASGISAHAVVRARRDARHRRAEHARAHGQQRGEFGRHEHRGSGQPRGQKRQRERPREPRRRAGATGKTPPGRHRASAIFGLRLGSERVHLCPLPGADNPRNGDSDFIGHRPASTSAS